MKQKSRNILILAAIAGMILYKKSRKQQSDPAPEEEPYQEMETVPDRRRDLA